MTASAAAGPAGIDLDVVPGELVGCDRWVCWRSEERDGRATKTPYLAASARRKASTTDKATWRPFDTAVRAHGNGGYDGIGFVLGLEGEVRYGGIDLDDCISLDGVVHPAAQAIVEACASYAEISPSGRGVKVFLKLPLDGLPAWFKRGNQTGRKLGPGHGAEEIEVYDDARYFTVTGRRLPDAPGELRSLTADELDAILHALDERTSQPERKDVGLHHQPIESLAWPVGDDDNSCLADDDVVRLLSRGANAPAFLRLYRDGDLNGYADDRSRADTALISHFAFYTRDPAQLERLMRGSALRRGKWDQPRRGETWLQATVRTTLDDYASKGLPRYNGTPHRPGPVTNVAAAGDLGDGETFRLPRTMSMADLFAIPEPPEEDNLVGPLLVRGSRTMIAAGTGAGKTTLAQHLIAAAVTGSPFLGFSGRGDAKVLIVDAEQGIRSLKRGLREAGLEESALVRLLHLPDGLLLDTDPQHAAELGAVLDDFRPDVLLLDPIYKLYGGELDRSEKDAVALMRLLDAWRAMNHFALVVTAHTRKPATGAKFTINELFGSSALPRGAELVLGLQRLSDNYSRLHVWKDRDGDLAGQVWNMSYSRQEGFELDESGGNKPTAKTKIAAALEENPDLAQDPKTLEQISGVSDRHFRRVLGELRAEQPHLFEPGAQAQEAA